MPVENAREKAERLVEELTRLTPSKNLYDVMKYSQPAKAIRRLDHEGLVAVVAASLRRLGLMEDAQGGPRPKLTVDVSDLFTLLLIDLIDNRRKMPLGPAVVAALVRWFTAPHKGSWCVDPLPSILATVNAHARSGPIDGTVRDEMARLLAYLRQNRGRLRSFAEVPKAIDRLSDLLAEEPVLPLEPGEAWSDAAIADIEALPDPQRIAWIKLLAHAKTMPPIGRPNADWIATAHVLVRAVGFDGFKDQLVRWFPLVDKPRTRPQEDRQRWEPDLTHSILPKHVTILRGLIWSCSGQDDRDLTRELARLAASAYRKVPGVGPRRVSLGNACVAVLGTLPGVEAVGQLAMLKTRVNFGTALREVEKAFDVAAQRKDLPREEIEELAVPAYGMEEVGRRREEFGDYVAEMVAGTGGVAIHWSKAGAPLKSAPAAAARKTHPDEWKELQGAAKDAGAMLGTVRDRLDALFLARKSWPLATWRQRYLDHPLVGVVARRLIWTFTSGGTTRDGTFDGGRLVGRDGREVAGLGEGTTVALWHPIGRDPEEVLGWRAWLEAREVPQPFNQAHREVYLLTDAERRTGVYSNRFAAHVLQQNQFHALCARGWKNRLRLMVDDSYPPATRLLPEWGLRAEFWVEGVGDDFGRDTTESGSYLYLSTDQVRFYPVEAPQRLAHASGGGYRIWQGLDDDRPLALEEVPPLVFSEVMRDVDLFVGVASVGNDPTWSDGGPNGRYINYWQSYSFGDLSATAQTRKAVLQRLVPRLKIADRCSFVERFLVVRGDRRTYKIHLGSGNILMEPNDQYLCIVPKPAAAADATAKVFLPFEGDGLLSIILSKALLLADDRKIKDETITRQIQP